MTALAWLPPDPDIRAKLRTFRGNPAATWEQAVGIAGVRLDFVLTNALDEAVRRRFCTAPTEIAGKPVRLAILGSATMAHLHPAIRVGGLRRGLWIETYENEYGQYRQELADSASGLHEFAPTAILLALDAHHLAAGVTAAMNEDDADAEFAEITGTIRDTWGLARRSLACPLIQQTALPVHLPVLGSNEQRLAGSRARFIARLNESLRAMAEQEGVDLLALDTSAALDGIAAWHDPGLWHRSKQEVTPAAAPMYGDLVARLLAAKQGRSAKCLVLDLDNTLWGGVIGDDGLEGIVVGQGSPLGEAYVAFQEYCRELSRRGVILAVCSKNDEANALEPFDRHPEMVLKRADIACFVANWTDKAANIRQIASVLNIGLDSLVFVDDNPFERDLVRQELPMVAVPEVGEDPAGYARTLADAGYFEALSVTEEDRQRTGQYQENRAREALKCSSTDLDSYLRGWR